MREDKLNLWQNIGIFVLIIIEVMFLPVLLVEGIIKSIVKHMFWLGR